MWHHQYAIHGSGCVSVTGQAPEALRWKLGVRRGEPPLLELIGDRYVGESPPLARGTFVNSPG